MKALARFLFLTAIVASTAMASDFSFTGTFQTDDQIQLFLVSLNAPTLVTFQSLGYAGGVNGDSAVIPPGGFDTYLTLFAPDGTMVDQNDDGGCGVVPEYLDGCVDAYLQDSIGPGTYTLALTESGNVPNGDLSDGFSEQGQGNFTCPQGFCDFTGNLDGNWAVDITEADSAVEVGVSTTPEPSVFVLAGSGLLLLALGLRRYAR